MENTNLTPAPHEQRLRAHGERLLNALEAQAVPKTYAEILRAARALIAVKKALDLIHKEVAGIETKARPARKPAAKPTRFLTEPPAEKPAAEHEEAPLNRQMRRMAEALARKQVKAGSYRRHASG